MELRGGGCGGGPGSLAMGRREQPPGSTNKSFEEGRRSLTPHGLPSWAALSITLLLR